MTYAYPKTRFRPRKPVRSFRDLEVYQKALEGAVAVAKNILPILKQVDYPLKDEMVKCSLDIPKEIAEAHSMRFGSKKESLFVLDRAMTDSNKIVVYLEQVRDIYSDRIEKTLCE